ncbi:MAG: hypothetical protein FWC98_05285, partial [Bacteroidales bacterium]|nr:hypothetical protein [Bacteroidales bacterium]
MSKQVIYSIAVAMSISLITLLLIQGALLNNVFNMISYYSDEERSLFPKFSALLALSLILIVSIVSVYAYTLYKMFQNRKLSEIKTDFINHITHEIKT